MELALRMELAVLACRFDFDSQGFGFESNKDQK